MQVILDMTVGEMSFVVNGVEQSVTIKELHGKTLIPMVQFYSNVSQVVELTAVSTPRLGHDPAALLVDVARFALRLLSSLSKRDPLGIISPQQTERFRTHISTCGVVGELLPLARTDGEMASVAAECLLAFLHPNTVRDTLGSDSASAASARSTVSVVLCGLAMRVVA